jgi:hypothetical protein
MDINIGSIAKISGATKAPTIETQSSGAIAINIVEPITIEINAPDMGSLPSITIPPLTIPLIPPVVIKFECPMVEYCGADIPCKWEKSLPIPQVPSTPKLVFPPVLNIPKFGFKITVPPPIFVECPAFPSSDYQENVSNKNNAQENAKTEEKTLEQTDANKSYPLADNDNNVSILIGGLGNA